MNKDIDTVVSSRNKMYITEILKSKFDQSSHFPTMPTFPILQIKTYSFFGSFHKRKN